MEQAVDAPAGSRLFIVCGKNVEVGWDLRAGADDGEPVCRRLAMCPAQAETLQVAFRPFGNVQNVKVIREKGGQSILLAFRMVGRPRLAALALADRRFWHQDRLEDARRRFL
jgi:hypothetical protein